VLREFAWDTYDDALVRDAARDARKDLEEIYNNSGDEKKAYRDILKAELRLRLLEFIAKEGSFKNGRSLELPKEFRKQFRSLVDVLGGRSGTKKLSEATMMNVFLRKNLLPEFVNLGILYATGIIYCLARLSIIILAFSSLRAMPDSVYKTTWAIAIPNVQ
jgi:hypothetical protein